MFREKTLKMIYEKKYSFAWVFFILSILFLISGKIDVTLNLLSMTMYAFALILVIDILSTALPMYDKYKSYLFGIPITGLIGVISYIDAKHNLGIILGRDPSFATATLSILTLYHSFLYIVYLLSSVFFITTIASLFLPFITLFRFDINIKNMNVTSRYVGLLCVTIIGIWYRPLSLNYNTVVSVLLDYADFQPSYTCPNAHGAKVFMIDNEYALINQTKSFYIPIYVKISCK